MYEFFSLVPYHSGMESSVQSLYNAVKSKYGITVFWWPGSKPTWDYVLCVMEKDQLIAKGQVAPIFIVEPGQRKSFTHKIYFNMKIHPI
jgi:hypothetical protein